MQLELCVASLESARFATTLPIDRIETCVALEQGGLTPTTGMVSWIHTTFHEMEQHVLIRSRAGGFHYSYDEIVVMRNDILEFQKIGVKGVVIGALKADFSLDTDALSAWHRAAGDLDLTFHRAFDEVKDWKTAMNQLINMGFKRILTSGQAKSVDLGIATLEEMVQFAAGRIEIMAGGGVRPENISLVKETGVDAIHFSGTTIQQIDENSLFTIEANRLNESLLKEIFQVVASITT